MSMHIPQGPRSGGDTLQDLAAIFRFLTRTPVGIAITLVVVVFVLFELALAAAPRVTLYMAQVKEPGDEEEREESSDRKACLAVVVEAEEVCRGDPNLPAPGGDIDPSMADAADVRSIFFASGSVDGFLESYFDLNVKLWDWASQQARDDAERVRRSCITQIITDRYGVKNTFVAYSGDISERNVIKNEIGWFFMPIAILKRPDYTAVVGTRAFAPFHPDASKEACGD